MKKIASVTSFFVTSVPEVDFFDFKSNSSIQYADIALFSAPDLALCEDEFGAELYGENSDYQYLTHTAHWMEEFSRFVSSGKTIFCFIDRPEHFFVQGNITNFYSCIPADLNELTLKSGRNMSVNSKERQLINEFWTGTSKHFKFQALLPKHSGRHLLLAKGTSSPVSSIFSVGRGRVIALPDPDFGTSSTYGSPGYSNEEKWDRILHALFKFDKLLHQSEEKSEPPDWACNFQWTRLTAMQDERADCIREKLEIEKKLDCLNEQIAEEEHLRGLLFETGKPLEHLVRLSLETLGFRVANYDDGMSEIDAIFYSDEGAFIGEIEGKDSAPINIDKLRQLIQIVNDDHFDNDTEKIGVLFGNAKRLTPPDTRMDEFTAKCLHHVATSRISVVRTMDLFEPTLYLRHHEDPEFAQKCRLAIKTAAGRIVQFPPIPVRLEQSPQQEVPSSK